MAKKVCSVCKRNLGGLKKKIPYGNKVVCKSCAEKMECIVCKNKLRTTEAKVLFNEGFFCPDCLKKTGTTSFLSPKMYTPEYINKFIEERIPLAQYYVPTKKIDDDFSVDELHNAFKVGGDIFEYKNLLSFELLTDNQYFIKGGIGRAIFLGVIFGALGALLGIEFLIICACIGLALGAITGGRKTCGICNMMKLKITVKGAHVDTAYIPFIMQEVDFDSSIYEEMQNRAQACISALEIIADYNNNQKCDEKTSTTSAEPTDADKILQFKRLLDEGVITAEEFNAKKKQILDLPVVENFAQDEAPVDEEAQVEAVEQEDNIEAAEPTAETEQTLELEETQPIEQPEEVELFVEENETIETELAKNE